MQLDNIVTDAIYDNDMMAEDWEWTPQGGAPVMLRAIPDEGIMTVREEMRPDVYNADIELKVRRADVEDEIKTGDAFVGHCTLYKVRSLTVLNTTEMVVKLTRVL